MPSSADRAFNQLNKTPIPGEKQIKRAAGLKNSNISSRFFDSRPLLVLTCGGGVLLAESFGMRDSKAGRMATFRFLYQRIYLCSSDSFGAKVIRVISFHAAEVRSRGGSARFQTDDRRPRSRGNGIQRSIAEGCKSPIDSTRNG